ncbi:UNVERIFIED_CONTAM: Linoleate 13S-lipoxygenase 2-1, chloroplastic [Sesamum calycinum]|uniref:Linoleate 13S-lipoxygenase 2-1, chloroplastic n=1 Tax=Sesamum calycinum TaxID=2727403 RepID=A0AAW2SBI3_9LAMI
MLPITTSSSIVYSSSRYPIHPSPDEEYIGEQIQPCWAEDKVIKSAFERFNGQIKMIEGIINARNADTELMNRTGAGLVPYEHLKPFSEAGVTGKGVPNSISI